MDEKIIEKAEKIYFDLKWETGMPQYLSLHEKDELWKEALEIAKRSK